MRRSIGHWARNRRAALIAVPGLLILLTDIVRAGDGDAPVLSPPIEMPIISKPATPSTVPLRTPVTRGRSDRAMLALPGLTTPLSRTSSPIESSKPTTGSATEGLSLDAPLEMKPLTGTSLVDDPGVTTPRLSRPSALEPMPIDEPAPLGGGSGSRSNPSLKRPANLPKPAQAPAQVPARRPRLFGFLPSPGQVTAPKNTTPGRSVVEEPREALASETVIKRRIETQVREVVGNRGRSIEVKVSGKAAVVQVTGVKFYQKRAVRKQLESLPALSGLRSTIEVLD